MVDRSRVVGDIGGLGGAGRGFGRLSRRLVVAVLAGMVLVVMVVAPSDASVPSAVTQVYAWGDNAYGQLGNGTSDNPDAGGVAHPSPEPLVLAGASGRVSGAAAGAGYSLVLTSTGQLYSFGDNRYGQLGRRTDNEHVDANGNDIANPRPVLVSLPGASGRVIQIAAGLDFSLAVTSSGEVYSWGDNLYGQLGRTTNSGHLDATGNPVPNPTPRLVDLPGSTGPATQIAAGGDFSLVLTSSGQLYSFGGNVSGQLGRAANTGQTGTSGLGTPNPVPMLVSLPGATGRISQIAAGGGHSLVVTSTGQLYSFGNNGVGQLARGVQ